MTFDYHSPEMIVMRLSLAFATVLFAMSLTAPARAQEQGAANLTPSGDAVYQIVKAEGDRVWRLNTRTGEIAVCALATSTLVCTTSTEAATPPARSYDQLQADAKTKRDADLNRDLAFLDTVFQSLKSMIRAAMERERVATVE